MTHRSYATQPVDYPVFDSDSFKVDLSVVQDFYNVLQGKGKFYDNKTIEIKAVEMLDQSKSYRYRVEPADCIKRQNDYDLGVQKFVKHCVQTGLVRSSTILQDLTKMSEAFAAGFGSGGDSLFNGEVDSKLPDLWEPTHKQDAEAANFLQAVCKTDHTNDIRLYCPTIIKTLQKVRDLACNVKAALQYNNGTAKTDSMERTDMTTQRACKSLQEARFLARSEYVHDTNTRLMRLATNQAQVNVYQRKTRKRFARFVLLDWSGSMQKREKYVKAAAVLLDSIESVVQNGDILHLAKFGQDFEYCGQVTKDNAQDLLLQVCNKENYQQLTDYGSVLHTAYNMLKADPDLQRLEIVLLSDGAIDGFKPLLVDDCKVHLVNLDVNQLQPDLIRTIHHCKGTITNFD